MMDMLFVNKDSRNFQKRSQQEARAINEHVNGTYARWQRDQRSRSNRHASVNLPNSRHSHDSHETPVDGSDDEPDVSVSSTGSKRHSVSHDGSRVSSRHMAASMDSSNVARSDSLEAPSSGLTPDDINAIRFATEFHVHALGLAEIPGVPANQLWSKWWLNIRQEIRRPETQLALLAWSYSSVTFVHSSSARDRVVKGLEFRGAALQQLQRRMQSLKSRGDYATALDSTMYLGCVEWQNGLINETIAHFRAAKSFLDMMGGVKVLPAQSLETFLWIFNNVSFTFTVRPMIRIEDLGRGSRHTKNIDSLSRMSLDESSEGIVGHIIGDRLASVLAETVGVIESHEGLGKLSITSNERIARFHELYMHKLTLQLNCAHLWHDMLEATPTSDRNHGGLHRATSPTSSFRSTFCLLLRLFQKISLDSFNSMIPWKKYWIPWHDRVLDRLRPIRSDSKSRTEDIGHRDREQKAKELILLWMFFTAACIEQLFLIAGARDVANTDRTIFCSSQFTDLARQMGYRRASDVAADLKKYVAFCATKQGQILKKLMQPLEHSRGGKYAK